MATVYKTSDGSEFNDQNKAYVHEYLYLGNKLYRQSDYEGAIASYDKAFRYCSTYEYDKRLLYYNRAMSYYKIKYYDNAIDDFSETIKMGYHTGLAHHFRGICYEEKGDKEQAIADYKKAADWGSIYGTDWGRNWYGNLDENIGKNNLERMGIEYTPETPPEVIKTWEENARASASRSDDDTTSSVGDDQRNGFVSFLFGLVGAVGSVLGIKLFIIPRINLVDELILVISICLYLIVPLVTLGVTYSAWRNKRNILLIIMLALIIPGYIGFIGTKAMSGKSPKPQTTQTEQTANTNPSAEITKNVNFRKGPSTNDEVIRQLKQGDIVILTGEVSGGWTQVTRDGEKGWVSNEYLKVWEK